MSLDAAIKNACVNLPDGWRIELNLEAGSGWPELFNGDDDNVTGNVNLSDLDLHEAITALVKWAAIADGKGGEDERV